MKYGRRRSGFRRKNRYLSGYAARSRAETAEKIDYRKKAAGKGSLLFLTRGRRINRPKRIDRSFSAPRSAGRSSRRKILLTRSQADSSPLPLVKSVKNCCHEAVYLLASVFVRSSRAFPGPSSLPKRQPRSDAGGRKVASLQRDGRTTEVKKQ